MVRRTQGKYEGEKTEGQFSAWCAGKGYFRLKLQVDKSNKSPLGKVIAKAMPSDFLVITPEETKFVEVKEVWKGNRFKNDRFRQQWKLTKLARHYPNSGVMDGYLLVYFVEHDIVCYFQIDEYNQLLKECGKKSLTVEQIPEKYHFSWKTLIL